MLSSLIPIFFILNPLDCCINLCLTGNVSVSLSDPLATDKNIFCIMTTVQRQSADEFCSFVHLRTKLGRNIVEMFIGDLLGFSERDEKWITPWGEDVSDLCAISTHGGFSSESYSMHGLCGWVLSERSMNVLLREFPDRLRSNGR